MKKKIIVIGLVIGMLVGIGIHISQGSGIEVETLRAKSAVFQDKIEEEGEVISKKEQAIFSELSGVVSTVHVHEGDMVNKDQILFSLDISDLEIQLKGLKGQLVRVQGNLSGSSNTAENAGINAQKTLVANAEASYQQLITDYNRVKSLYEAGGLSEADYEEAELNMASAKQALSRERAVLSNLLAINKGDNLEIQSSIEKIERLISKATVKANGKGYVTNFNLLVGDAVEQMLTLGNIVPLEEERIEVMLLADRAYGVAIGDEVIITRNRSGVDDILNGQIVYIAPNAIEQISSLGLKEKRVKVEIELSQVPEPSLIVGSQVDVEFIVYKLEDALMIPKTAVFYSNQGDAVWLVNEERIRLNPIELGYENSRTVEVISGLKSGDQIIRYYDEEDIEEGVTVK